MERECQGNESMRKLLFGYSIAVPCTLKIEGIWKIINGRCNIYAPLIQGRIKYVCDPPTEVNPVHFFLKVKYFQWDLIPIQSDLVLSKYVYDSSLQNIHLWLDLWLLYQDLFLFSAFVLSTQLNPKATITNESPWDTFTHHY